MDTQAVWAHIHAERLALAATLADLTPEQWQADSLCAGWTVQDVAAHVISHPLIGWAQMPGMVARNFGRSYNAMIFREVKRMGASSTRESILAAYAAFDGCTRKVPTTTVLEPLMDCLVHHQDIVRPLGLRRDMDPEAAAVAADRARTLAFLSGTRKLLKSSRMVATDVDWVRGSGPTITGPMQELLMVCMGRARVATEISGDGLELLAQA